ncbi:hypothetical protein [Paenibacillus sp. FSL H7-0331]|uniref:hypothetical protein n=1 Tax=Paenibacillus sp. FSL H7-0331 TaxID=1920421 RepID=UPI00096D99CF|nr:hypothetical protein [Paenibacillus sp. FSL H7-0331]OME98798.1 hypothetical protein BK127_39540 [Paenibacillus sp. FSL H7-0331]
MINMVRNVTTSESNGMTRLYFEPSILEAWGFLPGDAEDSRLEKNVVVLVKSDNGKRVISKRQCAGWKEPRPYFDRKTQR